MAMDTGGKDLASPYGKERSNDVSAISLRRCMKLSVVTTLYRSAPFIRDFHSRVSKAAAELTSDFEIVFVNDGSPDESLAVVRALHEADPRVVVVDLSRNFGHHHAMMAGLREARGERVFLIDVDLEEEPECLASFAKDMDAQESDVVYGVQQTRRGNVFEVISGNIFYWMIRQLGGIDLPRNLTTMRLMTRRYVDSLLLHRERQMIISALWQSTGYKQVARPIVKLARTHKTNYSIGRRIRFAVDHLTVSANNLLYFVFYFGVATFVVSFLTSVGAIAGFLVTRSTLSGWTSVIASIWMFGGLSVLLIGLVGIYVARIFEETKQRPPVITREVLRRNAEARLAPVSTMHERAKGGS